jgi:hypothetical protein
MRSQTATEYLIIVAVVIIIALIVVTSLPTSIRPQTGTVQYASMTPVAIKTWTTTEYSTFITLANTGTKPINLLTFETNCMRYQIQSLLNIGEAVSFSIPGAYSADDTAFEINYTADTYTYSTRSAKPVTNACTGILANLVGFWTFDGTVKDSSKYDNTAVLFGDATYGLGKTGKGLALDGTNDYAWVNGTSSLYIPSVFTLVVWQKRESITSDYTALIRKDPSDAFNIRYQPNSAAITLLVRNATSNQTNTSSHNVSLSSWQHIAGTYDSNTLRLYINGSLIQSQLIGNWSPLLSHGQPIAIGRDDNQTGRWFNGTLDQIMIFNRTLSDTEISQLFRTYN